MNGSEKQERAWALSLLFSEGAVGPVTGLTAKAQPALAHHGEIRLGHLHTGGNAGQGQIEMVAPAYITQPGRPQIGVPSSK